MGRQRADLCMDSSSTVQTNESDILVGCKPDNCSSSMSAVSLKSPAFLRVPFLLIPIFLLL